MIWAAVLAISADPGASGDFKPTPRPGQAFVENRGQWPADVQYRADFGRGDFWVTNDGWIENRFEDAGTLRRGAAVRVRLEGASGGGTCTGLSDAPGIENTYGPGFVSLGAKRFNAVLSQPNLTGNAPGVAIRFNLVDGTPRYDLILAPGVNPDALTLQYQGATDLAVDRDGQLTYRVGSQTFREQNLYAYQTVQGQIRSVPVRYRVSGNRVGFAVGPHDAQRGLTIDPQVMVRGSFIGGDNTYVRRLKQFNGDLILAGFTNQPTFPTHYGAYSQTLNGLSDAFVTRLRPDPADPNNPHPRYILRYSTFLAGIGANTNDGTLPEVATDLGLGVNSSGAPVVSLRAAGGKNWPVNGDPGVIVTAAPIKSAPVKDDFYVCMLDASLGQLYSATYFGGSGDEYPWSVDVNANSNIVICGGTASTDYPTFGSGARGDAPGNDAVVTIINPKCTASPMSTYFGGGAFDLARSVRYLNDLILIGGSTASNDLPGVAGRFDTTREGTRDGFIARLRLNGSVQMATYFGGAGALEAVCDVEQAPNGDIVAGGFLSAATYATASASNLPFATANAIDSTYAGIEGFIVRFDANLTRKIAFTFVGGSDRDVVSNVHVRPNGQIIASGYSIYQTAGVPMPYTSDAPAVGTLTKDRYTGFLLRMNNGLTVLQHGLRMGGAYDHTYIDAFVETGDLGNIVVAGYFGMSPWDFPNASFSPANGTGFFGEIAYYSDPSRIAFERSTVRAGRDANLRTYLNMPCAKEIGQTVTYASSDPTLAWPDTATQWIPQDGERAEVAIHTARVAVPTPVTLYATSSGAVRSAVLNLVP